MNFFIWIVNTLFLSIIMKIKTMHVVLQGSTKVCCTCEFDGRKWASWLWVYHCFIGCFHISVQFCFGLFI